MHYNVLGRTVRTEDTAKPKKQASSYLSEWIRNYPKIGSALDYGCGRLRYTRDLAAIAASLTLVDSDEQLMKVQTIEDCRTTLGNFVASKLRSARLLSISEFAHDTRKYDLVLCANVLPMIPDAHVRADVIRKLSKRVRRGGKCLFVSQFRNSYFTEMQHFVGARHYLDGWATIRENGRSTYFGILPRNKVIALVSKHGFRIVDSWIHGQSAYVLCAPTPRTVKSL